MYSTGFFPPLLFFLNWFAKSLCISRKLTSKQTNMKRKKQKNNKVHKALKRGVYISLGFVSCAMFRIEKRDWSNRKEILGKENSCALSCSTADYLHRWEVALSTLNLILLTIKLGLMIFTNLSTATQFINETQFCLKKCHITEYFTLISSVIVRTLHFLWGTRKEKASCWQRKQKMLASRYMGMGKDALLIMLSHKNTK